MPRRSQRPKLLLTGEEREQLDQLRESKTAPWREVQRAKILWRYHSGETITEISRSLNMTRVSVGKWIGKALQMGAAAALKDAYHRPKEPVITEEDKAWVVHLACSKPKDLGYAAEVWSRSLLAKHVREHAGRAGHPSLALAAKATVQRILAQQPLHPEKVKYYLERRDPDFEARMREVLLVYREVALHNEKGLLAPLIVTVSVDEKPGLQAIANTAPDLPPVPGKHATLSRDHEYKRLGTCSILAGLDLHDGHVTARVERRHRSREFIALLQDLDQHYPCQCTIRLILDNHSAHVSKETRAFLQTKPNRFKYVLTPKHGSWLNIVETLFGKMARTFLRHIRVQSWEELRDRILKGISEINADPVVHRWRKFQALSTEVTDSV
ncbi:MAG TPA: IS630 family transposase [Bryobacteraceae bacterium]|nr:IS630 family transposase [Bryobacteraceae bacterium]